MGDVKEVNIKNRTYYFFDDMTDIRNFHSNLLKIDKKSHEDIDIYYIGYITSKKFSDCENIHSVNPLYLITHSATGHFKEKNDEKYLMVLFWIFFIFFIINIGIGTYSENKTLTSGKELFYEKNYARIGVNTDDELPLKKLLTFPTFISLFNNLFKVDNDKRDTVYKNTHKIAKG